MLTRDELRNRSHYTLYGLDLERAVVAEFLGEGILPIEASARFGHSPPFLQRVKAVLQERGLKYGGGVEHRPLRGIRSPLYWVSMHVVRVADGTWVGSGDGVDSNVARLHAVLDYVRRKSAK